MRMARVTRLAIACAAAWVGTSSTAAAEVFVLGNSLTGHVVVRGNAADASPEARRAAMSIRENGWELLFADNQHGWAAVSCVARKDRYHFFLATGHPDRGTAMRLAKAAADRFVGANGGRVVFLCAPAWEDRGQPLALGGDGHGPPEDPKPQAVDNAINEVKGFVRRQVAPPAKDYNRDCVRPPDSARAEIRTFTPGAAPSQDPRPPARVWKPADWCPPAERTPGIGIRN